MLTLGSAMELCERHVRSGYVRGCHHYGEPGYSDPERGILFADWNDSPKWLINALERRGFALEWEDEWLESYETDKAYRSSPDCYGWTPSYWLTDSGDVIGADEIKNDSNLRAEYITEKLLNNCRAADTFDLDLTTEGFSKFNGTYESGWHPGQNDDPAKVFKLIRSTMPAHDVMFQIDHVGQFDSHWTAWTRPKKTED